MVERYPFRYIIGNLMGIIKEIHLIFTHDDQKLVASITNAPATGSSQVATVT